jgi:hypothetical protein
MSENTPKAPAARFLDSMTMDYEKWHDGTGYDLDALRDVPQAERNGIESILIEHAPRDWRDIEALAVLDTPKARKAIEVALKHSDPRVRREAMLHAPEKVDTTSREQLLIDALNTRELPGGLGAAIDEVPDFHPQGVIDALFRGLLKREGEVACNFAAMLYFLYGKAAEPFDWDHRPFFLRFNTNDRTEREAVYRELCATLGVDPKKYLH